MVPPGNDFSRQDLRQRRRRGPGGIGAVIVEGFQVGNPRELFDGGPRCSDRPRSADVALMRSRISISVSRRPLRKVFVSNSGMPAGSRASIPTAERLARGEIGALKSVYARQRLTERVQIVAFGKGPSIVVT